MRITKKITVEIPVEYVNRVDELKKVLEIPTYTGRIVFKIFPDNWIQAPRPGVPGYVEFAWEEIVGN
ncbi:MAG TPA: hypothetical protein VHK27_06115, partial [Gammaproteobacteria bacterium]|nr:hypothetical protein [Gammaproteobacteria bacterium]